MSQKRKIIVSVINNLETDQRVDKICNSLIELGFDVLLVGRMYLSNEQNINRPYKIKRFRLLINKGPLFYACFNIRLFFFLLKSSQTHLWSNDLDTLLPNYLVSRLKSKKLIYDSHEYFTEVPELASRRVKKIWRFIEKEIFPNLKNVTTVTQSIADKYSNEYGVKLEVVRNLPVKKDLFEVDSIQIPGKKTIIYQGSLNVDRGLEEMILAMKDLRSEFILYVFGDGDVANELISLVKKNNLENDVVFKGKVPFKLLHSYTVQADLGLSLEKGTNLNYTFSLPNKLFDYIHAEIPVLTSNLPEIQKIVDHYKVGELVKEVSPKEITKAIQNMFSSEEKYYTFKQSAKQAKQTLLWDNEFKKINHFFG